MKLVRTTCCYQGKEYGIINVTPSEDERDWTLDGLKFPLHFGSIALLNAIGDDNDEPKDWEAEKIDDEIFYYDLEVDLFWGEDISEDRFKSFLMRVI